MKKIIISLLFSLSLYPVLAQNEIETVLREIESNSTRLKALYQQMKADKLDSKTGIYLSNPELEFGYLWGSPSSIGKRTDFSVSQSFDFPTAYGYRNKISKKRSENAELNYKSERINLLLDAKQICIELIYYNALKNEYHSRLSHAERIAETYNKLFEQGEVNIIEKNKADLNLTKVRNEVSQIEIERLSLLSELKRLNGGNDLSFNSYEVKDDVLPNDFDEWFTATEHKNPMLQYIKGQIAINHQQVKLNQALGLPRFAAGYMREKTMGEGFQGVSVGISIPLWENKNRVKQAEAELKTKEMELLDQKMQFYMQLKSLFNKATVLQTNSLKYRNSISVNNNGELLKKALDSGEISLLDYLMEIEYYYEAIDKVLETEKEFRLTLAQLSAVEL